MWKKVLQYFIDDYIIYCNTYFLINKYKALKMFKYYNNGVENQLDEKKDNKKCKSRE